MYQWDDTGIVISVTKYGEQSAIVRALTADRGLFPGMVKGAMAKSARGTFQPGNMVHLHWQARLEEQLGQMRGELLLSSTAQMLSDNLTLQVVNTCCAIIQTAVPERIREIEIFLLFKKIIQSIHSLDYQRNRLLALYVRFEQTVLQALGFGLDLDSCVATGSRENLVYVSPKSGRAVCAEAGEPYKTKMFSLPEFLKDDLLTPDTAQILDGLALTGYFLEEWVLQPEGKRLPDARRQLIQLIPRLKPQES